MSRQRAVLSIVVPALLLACSEADRPIGPDASSAAPVLQAALPSGPVGIEGFAFLAPIVRGPATAGDRDASLLDLLAVEICAWDGVACAQPILRRITSGVDLPSQLRLRDDGSYMALWSTGADALDTAITYRIRVLASGGELGHVDVDVIASGAVRTRGGSTHVELVAGAALPITFAIEKGTGSRIDAEGGTMQLAEGVTLAVPAGALQADVFLTARPTVDLPPAGQPLIPGTAWDFGPDGLTFATPVVMTIAYDPSNVPQGVAQSELRIHKLVNGSYEQQDAGLVDLVNHTVSAEVDGFSVYLIIVRDPLSLEDIEAPTVRGIEVRNASSSTFGAATTLDVSGGDATLFTRVSLRDNGAGLEWIDVRWVSPSGRQVRFPCYRGGPPNSGSDTNGDWECAAVFPRHTEPGLWRPQFVSIWDRVQNRATFTQRPTGFCQTTNPANCLTTVPQITVSSASPDLTPPMLQSFGVSLDVQPRAFGQSVSVDASTGSRRVWFGFQATDDLAGIGGFLPFDNFGLNLIGPAGQTLSGGCFRTGGSNLNGFWECLVDIPAQAQAGTWQVTQLRVPDRVGNGGWAGTLDFRPSAGQLCNPLGNCVPSPTVQVTSAGDGEAPSLQSLNIVDDQGAVTTTLGIRDNLSAISSVRVRYTSLATTQFQECFALRSSGTAIDGTWRCTVTFTPLSARGQWVLSLQVFDVAGNSRSYSRRASDGFLCYFAPGIGSVCEDFGDTDLILF